MNKPDNNDNSPENIKSLLIKSFLGPFLQLMGQSMGWVIIVGIGLLLWQHFVHIGPDDGGTAIVVGGTTAAVLVTMLETPLVVAVGVGILVWWIVQHANLLGI
ncbi:hypothetical protein [Laspinema olomoucense]|uniref:hypothetical protein n=1 Tax=Laspinema olomoucense TaxID=3231600 RepID=UPI0021BAF555|nr:hypothetical protein [Laspinema sp. D3c]MCT7997492.1 hypothetical protein [Laspinema sp. D3c]